MNKGHIKSGEVIDLETLRADMDVSATHALVRTQSMEVIRMVLPKGKKIDEHSVEGEVSMQCLAGEVQLELEDGMRSLKRDDWLYLEQNASHALTALKDSILLLTILFKEGSTES